MATAEEIFAGIADAAANNGGNYVTDGKYTLIVNDIKLDKLDEGWTHIAEFVVEKSANVKVDVNMLNDGEEAPEARLAGESVSDVQKIEKFKSAAGNVVALICALAGANDRTLDKAAKQKLLSEARGDKYRGHRVTCNTYRKEKRGKKGEFMSLRSYKHVDNTPEMVAEGIKILEGGAPAGKAPESGGSLLDAAK
jgi:hypothetical protein